MEQPGARREEEDRVRNTERDRKSGGESQREREKSNSWGEACGLLSFIGRIGHPND